MLTVTISDQLGNQMFAYASVKTIAQNRGESFGFVRAKNNLINDTDKQYGNEIHTIFPNTKAEFLTELPTAITHTWEEPPLRERTANYQPSALTVPENTLMKGHFISCQYFWKNRSQVQKWFSFPEDMELAVQKELAELQTRYPGRPLVATHFRVGRDYTQQGFRLADDYWFHAADEVLKRCKNPVFLLFYDHKDEKGGVVNDFLQKYDCEVCRGSLVHDLCMMSKCHWQIICNSSFSIMSAVLNANQDQTILRPSVYPVGLDFQKDDCFAEEWISIPARQDPASRRNCHIQILKGKILKLIRH